MSHPNPYPFPSTFPLKTTLPLMLDALITSITMLIAHTTWCSCTQSASMLKIEGAHISHAAFVLDLWQAHRHSPALLTQPAALTVQHYIVQSHTSLHTCAPKTCTCVVYSWNSTPLCTLFYACCTWNYLHLLTAPPPLLPRSGSWAYS